MPHPDQGSWSMNVHAKEIFGYIGSGEGKDISLILHWVLLSPVYFIFKCTHSILLLQFFSRLIFVSKRMIGS